MENYQYIDHLESWNGTKEIQLQVIWRGRCAFRVGLLGYYICPFTLLTA